MVVVFLILLPSCAPSRDEFPAELAKALCAAERECQADDAAQTGDSFDYSLCVEQLTVMNNEEMCGFSGRDADQCLEEAREETCADRDQRIRSGDFVPEACVPLFRCD